VLQIRLSSAAKSAVIAAAGPPRHDRCQSEGQFPSLGWPGGGEAPGRRRSDLAEERGTLWLQHPGVDFPRLAPAQGIWAVRLIFDATSDTAPVSGHEPAASGDSWAWPARGRWAWDGLLWRFPRIPSRPQDGPHGLPCMPSKPAGAVVAIGAALSGALDARTLLRSGRLPLQHSSLLRRLSFQWAAGCAP